MRVAVFGTKAYDEQFLNAANAHFRHDLTYFEGRLSEATVGLARGFPAVCVFVNDRLDEAVLDALAKEGTGLVALRCAGYNNVDLRAADRLGVSVVRVPAYGLWTDMVARARKRVDTGWSTSTTTSLAYGKSAIGPNYASPFYTQLSPRQPRPTRKRPFVQRAERPGANRVMMSGLGP